MQKKKLSFWQIWNMSFGFLGIQFGFALQNANVSRIFETLGASIDAIPILWIAAPTTGLLVQPIIGYMSDRTWGKMGRRRPYFLVGAILASLALIVMPNSPVLWIAAGMLWILDASINISMEPFRALVADLLPSDQRTTGFAVQSFFIGTGAVIASALPYILTNWLGISNTAPPGEIPDSVTYSFYIGALAFITAVTWTVIKTKEYPPENIEEFEKHKNENKGFLAGVREIFNSFVKMPKTMIQLAFVQFFSWFALFAMWIYTTSGVTSHVYDMDIDLQAAQHLEIQLNNIQNQISPEDFLAVQKDIQKVIKLNKEGNEKTPISIKAINLFLENDDKIEMDDQIKDRLYEIQKEYNTGADWVGVLFAVYNGFAAITAFLLPWLAGLTSRKTVHMISLIAGGIGLLSFYFITDPNLLILSELGIGLAWASILAMPYAILAGSLPAEKMGVYMGIFNFFIVIPQITAAGILGFFMRTFLNGDAIYAVMLGGFSLILAAILVLFVDDVDENNA